ncbi:MAG: glycogen/starch synthase, partial [Candidatus Omnitrophota bacterium]|nr:glycogen/starch synthase [Candidatus Omnitrophota bacterium]
MTNDERRIIRSVFLKLATWLIITSQVAGQTAHADIKSINKVTATLAAPSIFQESSPDEKSEEFKKSILSDIKLLSAAFAIAAHFLIENKFENTLSRTIRDEFRNSPHMSETLKWIDLANVKRIGDIVYIPYSKNGNIYEIRITARERLGSLLEASSQWALSKSWGIQIVAGPGDRNREKPSTRANDESLIGRGFRNEDLDRIPLVPWAQSEDFRVAVERDLPRVIDELPMSAGLRRLLHRTLDDFKNGKDGCKLGMMPGLYVTADRWYIEFGTSQSIGVAMEFFDPSTRPGHGRGLAQGSATRAEQENVAGMPAELHKTNPFYPHRLQALFHALFHAALNREEGEEYHELRIELNATAHLDAMRFSALKWWGVPPELHETVRCATVKQLKDPDQTALPGVRNEFGEAIRAWKLEQSKIPTRMAEDNWKALLVELRHILRPNRPDAKNLFRFLNLCTQNPNPIFGNPHRYPTESRYPVLRAVALLGRVSKEKLKELLGHPDNAYMLANPIVDSILLMLNGIPKDWLAAQAPEIQGRRVWEVSPELWHAGGGLGRVKQFEGIAMKEFLKSARTPFCHVEPYYHYAKNRLTGERQRVDYSRVLGIKDDAPPEEKPREVFRIPVEVGNDTATAVCYRAINEHGIETFLIKGFKKGQDIEKDVPYYTPMLYEYDSWYGPDGKYNPNHGLTRDEFAYFLSAASLELIKRVEESARFANEKAWRPPIMHFSDGQLGFAPYLKKTRYANDPVLEGAFVAFTTHTYFNRQAFKQKFAQEVPEQTYLLRPSGISHDDEMKYFQHHMDLSENPWDRFASVSDYSSAGIRSADWVNGVSAEHVRRLLQLGYDTWGIWANVVDLVAVTNGDVRELTAARFRQAMRQACGDDVDVEEPTSGQVAGAKRRSKEMLNEDYGTNFDPGLPVLSYSGRGVDEKAGRHRALSDYNIEEMVKMGAQVVIGCNVQASPDIVGEWERLEAYLLSEKEKDPVKYKGAFILMRNIDITVQRSILAASDFQVQDSDPVTEAAGFSEADISACAGIEIAPPWREGILQMQGVRMNLNILGEGNCLIPEIEVSESDFPKLRRPYDSNMNKSVGDAYLDIIRKALSIGDTMEDTMKRLAHYQATSVRLSRVLEARLTVAEYMRQWSKAIAARAGKTAVFDGGTAPQSAAADTAQDAARGMAISLTGLDITPEQHASLNEIWRALIAAEKARSLFAARPARLSGDVDIPVDTTEDVFFAALRTFAKGLFTDRLNPDFDVIIGDDDNEGLLPAFIVLHPGNRRTQAYIPRSYMKTLSDFFAALEDDWKRAEFIQIVFEAFMHEDMHLRQYKSTLGSRAPPISEIDIDRLAPSFRARALFRLAYACRKTGIRPDISRFLSDLKKSGRERISYLNGYLSLDPDKHLAMARGLLAGEPSQTDIILAQHHLGAVFNHAEISSPI